MPPLNLSGRLPEQHNAVVNLDMTSMQAPPGGGAASEFSAWPEFHNGVAAGHYLPSPSDLYFMRSGPP